MKKLTRREFLYYGGGAALSLYLASRTSFLSAGPAAAIESPQLPLPGSAIRQFVDPVPNLLDAEHLVVHDGGQIELQMREYMARILPAGTIPDYAGTYVWSYLGPEQSGRTSYVGPVVLARRGAPTEIKFVNQLGRSQATGVLAYRYGTDQTLHWADPLNGEANMWNHMAMPPAFGSVGAANYDGPVPTSVHLHGGEVPPELDGGPDAWFTSDGQYAGHGFYSRDGAGPRNYCIYRYPNSQEAALLWFHDHTLGVTRLSVYAGLAGAYLLTDPANDPPNLPELFPLIIQDRMFDRQGQLYFPAAAAGGAPNPDHPYWVPEFIGDTVVVNGKTWPYMDVAPRRYTFLLINGSNARAYRISLGDPVSGNPGPPLWVIGTDGGYLDRPVKIDPADEGNSKLVLMPGERYWVIVDFKGYEAGRQGRNGLRYSGAWNVRNNAKAPYPTGDEPYGNTLGVVMQFRVGHGPVADTSYNPATRARVRQSPMIRLTDADRQARRQLTLNEVMGMPQTATDPVTGAVADYEGGPLEVLLNNTEWSGERITGVDTSDPTMPMVEMEPIPGFTRDSAGVNYLSELPREGTTELWEIINLTADAHPIHLHLVQCQLLNRQAINVNRYARVYAAAFPGGGYDPMTKAPYPKGVYIPGFGPPLPYKRGAGRPLGGNPDVNALDARKRPLYLKGRPQPPLPQENGWKDTVVVLPGKVTRILVRWAPTDIPATRPAAKASFPFDPRSGGQGYVWHCHILDHEDNEMMRPTEVVANNVKRTYVKGTDY
jgi:FtsP/CotA-like multicopper oxidase with cupredoxin domain